MNPQTLNQVEINVEVEVEQVIVANAPNIAIGDTQLLDPIFFESGDGETKLDRLFVNRSGENQMPLMYSTKLLDAIALSNLHKIMSDNIVNIKGIVDANKEKAVSEVISVAAAVAVAVDVPDEKVAVDVPDEKVTARPKKVKEVKVKKLTKAEEIIKESNKLKLNKSFITNISLMKVYAEQIIDKNNDNPTISSLEGMVRAVTTNIENKIMKFIILKSLIRRYIEMGDDNLIFFIFEFIMLMNDYKSMWVSSEEVAKATTGGKATGRNARKQVVKAIKVTDFEYPTLEEVTSDAFTERIKIAIQNTVAEGKRILESRNIDVIKYQMVDNYHRLKPLCFWDAQIRKLDPWQLDGVKLIDNKECVVVCAPTSSGKTVLSQYVVSHVADGPILFVVPNSILCNQVAASFARGGYSTACVTNEEEYNLTERTQVIVCTPYRAEEILCGLDKPLGYAVFDEIQQINGFEGECIERLIKTVNCPFLILSATIFEPEKFINYLNVITGRDVKLIKYNKRFIVQQKKLFDSETLIDLHPLACIDHKYIIEDQFKSGDLAMTARDVYTLGCDMHEFFPDFRNVKLHPNDYFEDKDISITVDMIEQYESHLKSILVRIAFANQDNDILTTFLQRYKINDSDIWKSEEKDFIPCIVKMFKAMKDQNLLPALVFMMNDIAVMNIFKLVVKYLEQIEYTYFPWYQNFMEKLHSNISAFKLAEVAERDSIAKGITSKGNKEDQINNIVNQRRTVFITAFINQIEAKYALERDNILLNPNLAQAEKDMLVEFLNKDFNYKYTIYELNQKTSRSVTLPEFNPYGPTSLFSFHKTLLSVQTMRSIRRNLRKFLNQTVDKSVADNMSYDNIFMLGLERGVIIYSEILPTSFKRVIQELILNGQAPVVMSDTSLAFGVNLPARTVVILGGKPDEDNHFEIIPVLEAQQMSGRSGRRGFETRGFVIYANIDYISIMRGTYARLVGKDTITPYTLLPAKIFSPIEDRYISNVIKYPLNVFSASEPWNEAEVIESMLAIYNESDLYKQSGYITLLLWYFRDETAIVPNLLILISELTKLTEYVHTSFRKRSDDDSDDDINDFKHYTDDHKMIFINEVPKQISYAIIELLFKVLDRTDDEEENEEPIIVSDLITKHPDFIQIMTSDIWAYRLNTSNNDIIDSVIQNRIVGADEGFELSAKIVIRVHKLIINTLRIYNLFASLGQNIIPNVLESSLIQLINFSNKIKSLN